MSGGWCYFPACWDLWCCWLDGLQHWRKTCSFPSTCLKDMARGYIPLPAKYGPSLKCKIPATILWFFDPVPFSSRYFQYLIPWFWTYFIFRLVSLSDQREKLWYLRRGPAPLLRSDFLPFPRIWYGKKVRQALSRGPSQLGEDGSLSWLPRHGQSSSDGALWNVSFSHHGRTLWAGFSYDLLIFHCVYYNYVSDEMKLDSADRPLEGMILGSSIWGILRGLESFSQSVYASQNGVAVSNFS